MSPGRPAAARIVAIAVAVGAAVAALSVVPPGDHRVAVVARLGGAVRLLPTGTALSFLPLARRVTLPREGGAAVLEVPLRLALAGGSTMPGRARVRLEGAGRLPVDAAAVRAQGWEAAWVAWLEPRLGPLVGADSAGAAAALEGSRAWREIFPSGPQAPPIDLKSPLTAAFAPLALAGVEVVAEPEPQLARAFARDRLARRAPARGRLIVIGLDGLDWGLVDDLTARGVMPNLARLLSRAAQVTVRMRPPLLSPLIWTTIATGQPPDVHGVLDFVERDADTGQPQPVTSLSRKVAALWEMAAAAGRTSAVIGWWATYPASAPPECAIYSDRLTEQLMGLEEERAGLVDPPDAAARASRLAVRGSRVTPTMLAPLLAVTQAELDTIPSGPAAWDHPIGGAARLMAATLTVERIADAELERGTQMVLAYIEGTDTVGHLFGACRPPATASCAGDRARRFGPVVDRYHAQIDGWLGTVVARMSPSDTLVILSDHGFTWGADRPAVASGAHTPTAVYWHRPDALFVAAGPRVAADRSRRRIEPLDILPTLLALAGLPPRRRPARAGAGVAARHGWRGPAGGPLRRARAGRPAGRGRAPRGGARGGDGQAAHPGVRRRGRRWRYAASGAGRRADRGRGPARGAPPAQPRPDPRRRRRPGRRGDGVSRVDRGRAELCAPALRLGQGAAPDRAPRRGRRRAVARGRPRPGRPPRSALAGGRRVPEDGTAGARGRGAGPRRRAVPRERRTVARPRHARRRAATSPSPASAWSAPSACCPGSRSRSATSPPPAWLSATRRARAVPSPTRCASTPATAKCKGSSTRWAGAPADADLPSAEELVGPALGAGVLWKRCQEECARSALPTVQRASRLLLECSTTDGGST